VTANTSAHWLCEGGVSACRFALELDHAFDSGGFQTSVVSGSLTALSDRTHKILY